MECKSQVYYNSGRHLASFLQGPHGLQRNMERFCLDSQTSTEDNENGGRSNLQTNRSTKGASKHRRDLINNEISVLRDMLPLPESARQRLSQLQIMSLACCYIRKCNYLARLFGNVVQQRSDEKSFQFSQSMTGFLLITTREGKLLYISENVTEYLGHSMVDMMTQGDSIYDIIDKRDHQTVQRELLHSSFSNEEDEERTFFCRMNVSRSFRRQSGFGDHKVMHVRGHYIQPIIRDHYGNQPVFMAICSPLITPDIKETAVQNSTTTFQSVHGLDMKYVEIAQTGVYHLGYTDTEMYGKSWYELLHPDDIMEAKEKHRQLIKSSHEMGCMLTARLQHKVGHWVWVNIVMHIRQPYVCDNGDPAIVCINQIIAHSEAHHFKVQSQLYSSHIARSPECLAQAGSPAHTITQVSVERETLAGPYAAPVAAAGQDLDSSNFYQGEFGILPQGSESRADKSQAQYDSGSSECGASPKSQDAREGKSTKVRADILSQLKRKIEQSSQQCRPAKVAKYAHSEKPERGGSGGRGSAITVQGAAFITGPGYYGAGGGGVRQFSGVEAVAPTSQGPIFTQLGVKPSVEVVPPVSPMPELNQPLTPLTPASSVASDYAPDVTDTSLTIDVTMCNSVLLPPSILTPDSSPTTSPTSTDARSEQLVPSLLTNVQEVLEELDILTPEPPVEPMKMPAMKVKPPAKGLPILDLLTLEDFLATVEGMPQVPVKDSPPATPPSVPSPEASEEESPVEEENQLNSLVSSVTQVLLDIVQSATDSSSPDILGEFMLVPGGSGTSDVSSVADMALCNQSSPTEASALDNSLQGDIISELNQLNQLAATTPSYGDDRIPTTVFDPAL